MRWLWYLTPFGWMQAYTTLIVFVHELGHLVVGWLTGHKIIEFRVGRSDPVIQFNIGAVRFGFAGDGFGGEVRVDKAKRTSQLAILATAMAGPLFAIGFATLLLFACLLVLRGISEPKPWMSLVLMFPFVAYVDGFSSIPREIRNIRKR